MWYVVSKWVLSEYSLSLLDVRDIFLKRNYSEDKPEFSGKLGLKLGDSKSFYQSSVIWKRETCASTCFNLYQVSKWSCDSHVCDTGGREPPFSCLLAWALTWGAYQLIQDLREDATYSGYTLFPCPKATFIFRKWLCRMRMWVYKFWKQYMWGFCV